jgi:hypothetical protein
MWKTSRLEIEGLISILNRIKYFQNLFRIIFNRNIEISIYFLQHDA